MFTFRRSKKKMFLGSGSPSEIKYEKCVDTYGQDPSFITSLGIKIFPNGEQFVINAATGRVIVRDKSTRYLGRDEETGLHLFLGENSELEAGQIAYPSFQKKNETA